ncbi:hypothetical protein E2P81_ATG03001 [Venturia nashicola]|uniref:Secreted protein n=1 Tax=Venturia nashicola TaxID=86259 RepID=A0A4Z1PJ68_9PEZI|nr:hypothetical protein E6O75_ATG03066 [Venturia nashicola]TLD36112.1 hypothetical protein E2P81_ATG03001 [Venturia nashicola]
MTGEYQGPLPGPPPGPPSASNQLSGNEVPHMASTSTAPTSRPVPETPPAYPPRPAQSAQPDFYLPGKSQAHFAPPPKRRISYVGDSASPVHYIRDPHKLIAYLVPFPKPDIRKDFLHKADGADIPDRFLIYTPPPPPLAAPREGEKEDRLHKIQRKWQQEVRIAKTQDVKVTSWKGVKGGVTKGINTAMGWTTTSSLDFLNRIPGADKAKSASGTGSPPDKHAEDGHQEGDQTSKTVGLEELVLVYPSTVPGTEEQVREEFVNSMLRSKSKAQKDAVIATGLLPVAFAVDMLAILIWPFGGLLEIDAVWATASIRGAKTARSVTKRLHSTTPENSKHDDAKLKLTFTPSDRLEVLRRYLAAECHRRDPKIFKLEGTGPTEAEVLEALGWSPSQTGGETRNWEDEQWEIQEVKEDLKLTMGKGGKEWDKWCKAFAKDPEKALKK